MKFMDDIKENRDLFRKITMGKRLSKPEQDILDDLKKKYGMESDGTVKSQDALADLLDVSRRTIIRWKKEGMPVEPDGSYDPVRVMEWRGDLFSEDDEKTSEKTFWDIEWRKFRALLTESEYKKAIGESISRQEVENLLVDRATELKKSLLSRARRLAYKITGKDVNECLEILEKDTLEILDIYSRPNPLVKSIEEIDA